MSGSLYGNAAQHRAFAPFYCRRLYNVRRFARDLVIEKESPAIVDEKMLHEWINDPEMKAKASSRRVMLRLSDVCQIEWACFEHPGEVVVWTDKRDKRVAVPISEILQSMLSQIPVTDPLYLFPEPRAIALNLDRRALFSVQFKRLCEKRGIKHKTFHGIRHTTIARWKKEGKTLEEIGRLVGHSRSETTKDYILD